jgi:hypothetical protein
MLPASKTPFPWLIVFFRKIESGFIWERGGVEEKTPTDPMPMGAWQKKEILKRVSHHAHFTD